jgi:ankyrin repeat protein
MPTRQPHITALAALVADVTAAALVVLIVGVAFGTASCKVERAQLGGAQESALVEAAVAHDVATVRRLLAAGADPNKIVRYQDLYHAPWELALNAIRPRTRETVDVVKAMLTAGANPKAAWGEHFVRGLARRYANEPLMLAMSHPDPEVVRAIMQSGLDPRYGETALVMAVENSESEIAHILIESGVNVNCRPGANTPLTAAIETRNVALMTYLEEHGAKEKP